METMTDDALPYAGTAGWSGSDTSRESAEREAEQGVALARLRTVLAHLREWGPNGCTVAELRDYTGEHHGKVSGALSVLHLQGRIARLADPDERREGCAVYVLPEHVLDRAVAPQGRHDPVSEALRYWLVRFPDGTNRAEQWPSEFAYAMQRASGIGVPLD